MKDFKSNRYIGWPYKKHGTDENGIDCLNLTLRYLKDQSYLVKGPEKPPDRKEVIEEDVKKYLEFFDLKNLQENDVLFFKWHNQIHSGVYLGDHTFLHASKAGSVVTKINAEIKSKFIGGIRPSKKKEKIIPYSEEPVSIGIAVVAIASLFTVATASTVFAATVFFAIGALTIAAMLMPQPSLDVASQSPRYRFGKLRNTRSNEIPVPLIYGHNWIAGNLIYSSPTEDKKTVYQFFGLGEGEIDAVEKVLANDKYLGASGSVTDEDLTVEQTKSRLLTTYPGITLSTVVLKNKATGIVIDSDTYFIDKESGYVRPKTTTTYLPDEITASYSYEGLTGCSYTAYTGTSTQNVDSRAAGNVVGLRRTAYVAYTLQASEELSSMPTIVSLVRGLKISTWDGSDWTSAETYSTNPAACIRDYLLRDKQVGGCGFSSLNIDDDSFGSVYETCNTLVDDGSGSGETEKRFELNYVIDTYNTALDNLKIMMATFGGYIIISNGKIKLGIRKSRAVTQAFTMSNIKEDSFSYGYIPKGEQFNRVGIQYIDMTQSDTKPITWIDDRVDQDSRGIVEKIFPIYGINKFSQANRLAWQTLYDIKINPICCSFITDLQGIACEPGDVISVTHDVPNWTVKQFLVAGCQEKANDEIQLQCIAYNSTIFNDTYGSGLTIYDYGSPPSPWIACDNVTNLAIEEFGYTNEDGVRLSTIDISFDAPEDRYFLDHYLVQMKKDAEDYKDLTGITETGYRTSALKVGSTYYVKIKSVTTRGIQSSGTTSESITIVGKDDPPTDVSSFICIRYRDSLKFLWVEITDIDVKFYQIRRGTTWDSATILTTKVAGKEWVCDDIVEGTNSYWIKAIDNSGNLSENATEAILAIDEIPFQNIIVDSDEHPAWTGTKVDTEISGNTLILSTGKTTGTYTTAVKDLGIICWAKIYIDVVAAIDQALQWNSDSTRKFNDDDTLRFIGFAIDPSWISFRVRTSEDNVDWTSWQTWTQGDYKCRYYQGEMTLTRDSDTVPVVVHNLTTGGDVPDVDEHGSGTITVANDGATVVFEKTFHAVPAVTISPLGATGVYFQFTSVPTTTGFAFKMYNLAGTAVAEAYSHQSHGY